MTTKTNHIDTSSALLGSISNTQAWHYLIIPMSKADGVRGFYISDKQETVLIKAELEIQFNCSIELESMPDDQLRAVLEDHYKRGYSDATSRQYDIRQSEDFLDMLIGEAKELKSSDIHIEVYEDKARVRIRIDGVLVERYVLDPKDYPVLINKLKIKAKLDIAEKRLPQDGRINFKRFGSEFDIRVSILPTLHGEKIVLRLLNNDATDISLDRLGMTNSELVTYREGFKKPNGIILISGPTGSGKTTTLYATLKELNEIKRNILTIEDPIEYTLEGINQVQLKENIGLTFTSALRSFLRQDPDVIMLGEIRDKETAEMAIRAALTGHLVLSTIHTNSAWGTISRLLDMKIPAFLLASTLNASVAQRLVRKLCVNCKKEAEFSPDSFPAGFTPPRPLSSQFLPAGCDSCFHTGYSGRKAVYEIISIRAEEMNAIRDGLNLSSEDLKESGVDSLAKNAFEIFAAGITSLEEVYALLMNH